MMQARLELFEEGSKKRGPPEPTDGLDSTKRARLGADVKNPPGAPPLPPGPVSIAQLFTLTQDEALRSFDVTSIPVDLVVKITLSVFQRADPSQLDTALNALRSRYLDISRQPPPSGPPLIPIDAVDPTEDEEDEYEPEFEPQEPQEDEEQRGNYTPTPPVEEPKEESNLTLKQYKLPPPQPMTPEEATINGKYHIDRLFNQMKAAEPTKSSKGGLNRLVGNTLDKDAWLVLIIRIATRTRPDLPEQLSEESKVALSKTQDGSLDNYIRENLWRYVMEDFRHRIDAAISWFNEEWYNEKIRNRWIQNKKTINGDGPLPVVEANYEKWVLKLLDAMVPYLDANDKILIRFLGEIPEVSETILERVKNLAKDPDRVSLAVKAI
jgi:symplekin